MNELSNLCLFFLAIAKAGCLTGVIPGIAGAVLFERFGAQAFRLTFCANRFTSSGGEQLAIKRTGGLVPIPSGRSATSSPRKEWRHA